MEVTREKEEMLQWIPYGTEKRVAKEMGIDYSTLRRALRSKTPKLKYMKAVQMCYSLAIKNKQEQQKLNDFKEQLSHSA